MADPASINPLQAFVCGDCGRGYRTKDSLTRHRHNHDDSNLHVCSTCSLKFNRSDVLSRHVRIHHRGRKRSPRACISCKVAKIKCDAGTPCARCAAASQTCKYEADANERHREQMTARQRGIRQRTASIEDAISPGNTTPVRVTDALGAGEMDQKLRTHSHIVASDLSGFLASPALGIHGAHSLGIAANGLRTVLPGGICPPGDVHPQGTSVSGSSVASSVDSEMGATDAIYNSKWWSNHANPWGQPASMVQWPIAESFQPVPDLNGTHFLDVDVNAFSHHHAPAYQSLQDFSPADCALISPMYSDSNNNNNTNSSGGSNNSNGNNSNHSSFSNGQPEEYNKRMVNGMSQHLYPYDEFQTQPSWPQPSTMSYMRAMENSYPRAYHCL